MERNVGAPFSKLTRSSTAAARASNAAKSSVFAPNIETELRKMKGTLTESSSTTSSKFGQEMRDMLFSQPGRQKIIQEGLQIMAKTAGNKSKNFKKPSGKKGASIRERTTSVMSELSSKKWIKEEREMEKAQAISRSLTKNPVQHHVGSYQPQGILEPGDDDKLITVGGYIINLEKNLKGFILPTKIRSTVSSTHDEVEIEVKIGNCNPDKIRVEKRYNAIIVIGVKESGIHESGLDKTAKFKDHEYGMGDDLVEVVNIFVPRDVILSRVIVGEADDKGRIMIKAP